MLKAYLQYAWAFSCLSMAVFSLACSSTLDRVVLVHDGETKQEVIERLGPPAAPSDLPSGIADPPEGCADHLVYKDEYDSAALRWVADQIPSCGGSWFHVCFDETGRALSARTSASSIAELCNPAFGGGTIMCARSKWRRVDQRLE
jgi:hypothetical protein